MAQFLTTFSILLILADFKPIVCPGTNAFGERRDRAPYIESSEHSPQYLGDLIENRSNKGSMQNKEHPLATQAQAPTRSSEQETEGSIVDKNIRSVFTTGFGPGLHLFNNTGSFVNAQPQFKSYHHDLMLGDQPHSHQISSSSSPTDKDVFKVQRSPDGKLSVVYNESYVNNTEKDIKANPAIDRQTSGSNRGNSAHRFPNHFSNGLSLKKGTSSPTGNGDKLDITDCLEGDELKRNKTYCSSLRKYPKKDHLEELIEKKFTNFEAFFGEDLIVPETIDHRMGNDPNEESFCRSHQVVIYPQSGQNADYEWFYIVNSDKFKQGIRIEECLDPYKACGEHVGLTLPSNYDTSCEQHYIYRTLVAYDEKKDSLFKETFRLPACCKCVLRNNLKVQ